MLAAGRETKSRSACPSRRTALLEVALGRSLSAPSARRPFSTKISETRRVGAYERVARRRDERREPGEEFDGGHQPTARALPGCRLRLIRDPAAGQAPNAIHRERWTRAVAAEFLAGEVVVAGDAHAGVHVEAVGFDGGRVAWSLEWRDVAARAHVGEFAALHRDLGAGSERRECRGLVRLFLTPRQIPFSFQPREGAGLRSLVTTS